jgi:hypothetical protein
MEGVVGGGFVMEGVLNEGVKELLLGLGDGQSIKRGDLGCGVCLL